MIITKDALRPVVLALLKEHLRIECRAESRPEYGWKEVRVRLFLEEGQDCEEIFVDSFLV